MTVTETEKTRTALDLECAQQVIDREIETLVQLRDNLDASLTQALDLMQKTTGRVIITGIGKSGHIGKKIAASLASTGTPAFFVHPAEASHGDLGMITENDVVIAISNSGESKELINILNYCKRFGIRSIAITQNPQSALGQAVDVLLKIPNNGEASSLGLAPMNSTTATLVLGDVLTAIMIERKGFTPLEFNLRHPGGKLGALLNKVVDLMHTKKEMPILSENATMPQVLLEMTSKRLGCVGFVNHHGDLTGILTDGDLRRCLTAEIFNQTARQIMNQNPQTISKDVLASEAIKIMQDKKITNLFITEKNKPIGVIHIHDLLNHGVV